MSTTTRCLGRIACFGILATFGCGSGGGGGGGGDGGEADTDVDGDTDSDTDTDSDADADTDSDTDTDACPDMDLDGYASEACGGDDCDDEDPAIHPGASDGVWLLESLTEDEPGSCLGHSFTVDAEGRGHASYARWLPDAVRIVSEGDGGWVASDVLGVFAHDTAVAVDAEGTRFVAFRNHAGLHVSHDRSGAFVDEIVDPAGERLFNESLAIDASGHAHVVYQCDGEDGNDTCYATNATGSWVIETIETPGWTWDAAIALAPDGTVHVSCQAVSHGPGLRYAVRSGGAWSVETIDDDFAGAGNSIEVASDGTVHVTYSGDFDHHLRHAVGGFGAWAIEEIDATDDAADETSIALGDAVHVAYWDAHGRDLFYATGSPGAFALETVDARGEKGYEPVVAVGPAELVRIVYADEDVGEILLASRVGDDGVDQDCDGDSAE